MQSRVIAKHKSHAGSTAKVPLGRKTNIFKLARGKKKNQPKQPYLFVLGYYASLS